MIKTYSHKAFADINFLFLQQGQTEMLNRLDLAAECYNSLSLAGVSHLYGHVGLLHHHAVEFLRQKKAFSFDVIETAGEYLDSSRQQTLRDAFQCQILNQYGTRETWAIGYDLGGNGLFELLPEAYVELIDSNGAPIQEPSKEGRIVVTSTVLRTFPIIRFSTGDRGRWAMRKQRRLLILEPERTSSIIVLNSGNALSGNLLMKRVFNRAVAPTGRQVLFPWKVRRRGATLTIYLHEQDMICSEAVAQQLRVQASFLPAYSIQFKQWSGWTPLEKRILFIDES